MGVHVDDLPVGAAAVFDPADVRQDGAAGARRRAIGLGRRDVLFPGSAAGWLLLRTCADQPGAVGHVPDVDLLGRENVGGIKEVFVDAQAPFVMKLG